MHGERLGIGYWIIGLAISAGGVYYWHTNHPLNQPTIVSAPSPTAAMEAADVFKPVEVKSVAPAPAVVAPAAPTQEAAAAPAATTEPAPAAAATPEVYDVPVVIKYDELMENAKNCPKKIRLVVETNFPAMLDGKQIGSVTAPAGSEVDFIKVAGEKSLVVGFGPAEMTVSADATNFEELYTQLVKASRKKP